VPHSEKHQIQADALQTRGRGAKAAQQVWGARLAGEEQAAFATQTLCKSASVLYKGRQALYPVADEELRHFSSLDWHKARERPGASIIEQPGLRPAHSLCCHEGFIKPDMVLRSCSPYSFIKKGLGAVVLCVYI